MDVAVLGLGKSGISACHFLQKVGYQVWATDDKICPVLENINVVEPDKLDLSICKFLVVSPGIPMHHPIIVRAKASHLEVIGDVELGFRALAKNPPRMCAITGTNGKTTTTELVTHMLTHAKKKAKAVGNIGVPFLEILEDTNDHFVIELSSFQLQTIETRVLEAAAIVNISPNHLDHHTSFEEYVECKLRLASAVKTDGAFYVQEAAHKEFLRPSEAYSFGFSTTSDLFTDLKSIFRFGVQETELPDSLKFKRTHHVENFLAAYALAREFDIDPELCVEAYDTFVKPPHRIQFVKTIDGVSYYDDSKATNVEAVLSAVSSFSSSVVLIAGGIHKGHPYHAWRQAFAQKVRAVILIGEAADLIEKDLDGSVPCMRAKTLADAVMQAKQAAKSGDTVLLSPGCSSFDMFTGYKDRGSKFQEMVHSLL